MAPSCHRIRIQALETNYSKKCLRISCLEHKTNDWVWSKINSLVSPQEPLLATVKRRKLAWLGRVTRDDSLSKAILHGHLGGWAAPWSVEEMLDGQHQRLDIPARVRMTHKGLLQKRLEEDLC